MITDGEFRRWMFMNSFYDAVSGVRTGKTVIFRNDRGEDVELAVHEIVEPLEAVDSPGAREAAFMREVGPATPFKVTFPAASIFAHPFTTRGWRLRERRRRSSRQRSRSNAGSWPTRSRPAPRYVQFDFPLYPYLVDPAWIARFEAAGHDVDALVDRALAADAAVLEGIPDEVTVGLHICRGNFRSSWMCEGSLEPVAERVFGGLPYDTFLVEWDDEGRDGGYAPVRHPARRKPDGHGPDQTRRRRSSRTRTTSSVAWRMPPRHAGGMERLAISPQCGFASVMVGNETNEDAQWRKLELVGRVADRLWS